jgi:hypothetical protein
MKIISWIKAKTKKKIKMKFASEKDFDKEYDKLIEHYNDKDVVAIINGNLSWIATISEVNYSVDYNDNYFFEIVFTNVEHEGKKQNGFSESYEYPEDIYSFLMTYEEYEENIHLEMAERMASSYGLGL